MDLSILLETTTIQLPEPVSVFLDQANDQVRKAYLQNFPGQSWCFLTAYDPNGKSLPDYVNDNRTCDTLEHVRKMGCWAIAHGELGCPTWVPLGGILIIGIAECHARILMKDLGQNAIVVGDATSYQVIYTLPAEVWH